jgi:DNA-binding transcriptional regulator YdaS (Cro superfamily)
MYRHPKEIIDIAIKRLGSRTQLAAHLEISTSTLDKIRFNTTPVPAKHCVELSRLTGVPLHYVNPDVFDPNVWILSPQEIELIQELREDHDEG